MNKYTEIEDYLLSLNSTELFYLINKVLIKSDFENEKLEQIAKVAMDLVENEFSVEFIDYLNSIL